MLFRRKPNTLPPITRIRPARNKKLKVFFWTLTIVIITIIGWIGITGIIAFNNIQAKNDSNGPAFFNTDGINPDTLIEGDTRINTLLIGADNAAGLTDSIQIYSIDPVNNSLAMLSVPRDLYVTNPSGGKSKINEIYNAGVRKCQVDSNCDPEIDAGAKALKGILKEILGINIHYFARVDFQGFRGIVDAIGGVQIHVEKALSDTNYPCDNDPSRPCGYYQPAGTYNMTGTQALRYARCRSGNCGSDFGRAARQQQVVEAIRAKLLTLGVAGNPTKIATIINTLGQHLRTDMKLDEMIRIFKLIQDVDKTKSTSGVLDNSATGPLQSINNGQYRLIPKLGQDNWTDVKKFVLKIMPEPYVIKEKAKIIIVDASGKKLGSDVEEMLTNAGYNVIATETASVVSAPTELWSSKNDTPYTVALLKKRFEPSITSTQPTTTAIEPDIVLVIGSNYVLN